MSPLQSSLSSRPSFLVRWYPGLRLASCSAVRLAGFVPVLLVLAMIVLAYITAVPATLLPLRTAHPLLVYPLLVLFHFIYLNVLANYSLLVLAEPGTPPDDWKAAPPPPPNRVHRSFPNADIRQPARLALAPVESGEDAEPDSDEAETLLRRLSEGKAPSKPPDSVFRHADLMHERSYDGSLRYCRMCASYKPDRAHHCSVCRRCILRMDHHCVFVNNCVSFYNHKFFVSFIGYAFIGCLFVAVVAFPTFAAVLSAKPRLVKAPQKGGWDVVRLLGSGVDFCVGVLRRAKFSEYANLDEMSPALKTLALVGYITSGAFAFALAIFVGLHFYLVAKGRTTIEMYELTDPTRATRVLEYDLGAAKNFRKVFGTVPLCWFFPTRAYVEGDGLTYERRVLPDRAAFAV